MIEFDGSEWTRQTFNAKVAYAYGWFAGFGTAKGFASRKDQQATHRLEICIKRMSPHQVADIVDRYLQTHPQVRQKDIGLIVPPQLEVERAFCR
jgi:hypothetical protein